VRGGALTPAECARRSREAPSRSRLRQVERVIDAICARVPRPVAIHLPRADWLLLRDHLRALRSA